MSNTKKTVNRKSKADSLADENEQLSSQLGQAMRELGAQRSQIEVLLRNVEISEQAAKDARTKQSLTEYKHDLLKGELDALKADQQVAVEDVPGEEA